jgi:hypothetical protein
MGIAIFAALFLTLMTIFSDYRHVGKETLEELEKPLEIKETTEILKPSSEPEEISEPVKSI